MIRLTKKLKSKLNQPADIAGLLFFRISVSVLVMLKGFRLFDNRHYYWESLIPPNYITSTHLLFWGTEWLPRIPWLWMPLFGIVLIVVASAVLIGWRYRICSLLLACSMAYLLLLDAASYSDADYLLFLFCLFLTIIPAHRSRSYDVRCGSVDPMRKVPEWTYWLIWLQMIIVYFFQFYHKTNWDWITGDPMVAWIQFAAEPPWANWIVNLKGIAPSLAALILLVNLAGIIYGFIGGSNWIVLIVFLPFWGLKGYLTGNELLFLTGLVGSLMFLPCSWPKKSGLMNPIRSSGPTGYSRSSTEDRFTKIHLIAFLAFVGLQLLIPFKGVLTHSGAPFRSGNWFEWRNFTDLIRPGQGSFLVYSSNYESKNNQLNLPFVEPYRIPEILSDPYLTRQYFDFLANRVSERKGGQYQIRSVIPVKVNREWYELRVSTESQNIQWIHHGRLKDPPEYFDRKGMGLNTD